MIVRDEWLGILLGCPAFNLASAPTKAPAGLHLPPGPAFVTAKVPVGEVAVALSLQDAGFRVIDTALTFDCERLEAAESDSRVRFARPADCAAVAAVAGSSFRYSRFHLDPKVPQPAADAIKAAWAENFFKGKRGDGMIVAELDGAVVGFLQFLRTPANVLVIDLIAVDERATRRGLAKAMIGLAGREGGTNGAPSVLLVGTQAANVASCRLYESLGFRLNKAVYVLHHHGLAS